MSDFDAATPLVMAKFKTVHGFNLQRGARLHIVKEPSVSGEVTEAMARRLFKSKIAVPADAFRPTPVETKEQEAARLTAGAALTPQPDESTIEGDEVEVQEDLRTTKDALRKIAEKEGVELASDDNKGDIQVKIMLHRASQAGENDAAPVVPPAVVE
jgi:hypothetical protein